MNATSWALPADLAVVGEARAMVRKTLTDWGLPHLVDDAELVISELVTNALVHGAAPVVMALHDAGPALIGAITDRSTTPLAARDPDLEDTGGRGLAIVRALAASWGVWPYPTGKTIWFTLLRDGTPT
ncbi:ATP-binding protein [Sphaerisporangium sp. NPDC049003]|uniref:ATP-binding protein n=1 Tax=Sphaerisporangium sp. NPDC049003 TaxID=3364517 RepID=UPI00371E1BF0